MTALSSLCVPGRRREAHDAQRVDFGSEPFVKLREMLWLAVFTESVRANLAGLIFTFAFDRTVRQRFITDAVEVIESGGGEVLFVELTCSVEELEKRIAHPGRQKFGKLSSVRHFRELKDAGAFAGPAINKTRLVVETTELPASDVAGLIVKELNLEQSD